MQAAPITNGLTCDDVDECDTGTHMCDADAACINTKGTYECNCNAGYEGPGVTCEDVDECSAIVGLCDLNAVCDNTVDSFNCSCKMKRLEQGACTDSSHLSCAR